jgi:uncharacterized damage-inducible protein DinB
MIKNLYYVKMKLKNSALVICLIMATQVINAQSSVADLIKEWERSKAYTMAYLDAMPESSYALRPTPEMRSFAEQLLHLADANYGLGSAPLAAQSPYAVGELEKSTDTSKTNVRSLVAASYDFIISNLKNMNEVQLNESIIMLGKYEMSKRTALTKVFEHQAHHRGQTTVYMRLAGITPPQEQLF